MFGSFFAVIKLYLVLLAVYCGSYKHLETHNSKVYEYLVGSHGNYTSVTLIIAHPDDEVMFFAPTLLQLDARMAQSVPFRVVCLTDGDADGLGEVRRRELHKALRLLVLERDVEIQMGGFKDGMDEEWKMEVVREELAQVVTDRRPLVLTFDERGVSGHRNHIACAHAAAKLGHHTLHLDSGHNLIRKYSFFFVDLFRLLFGYPMPTVFLSTFSQYLHSLVTMLVAHKSQMVWFRWGWWTASRYVYANEF
ncbi:N-acetylglucosaminylphosphatidylinositol deacetylase Ecym_4617 [Eremothecium cymbalariae DBVPG|uniref:N-acetylglucosaminylphosphatidylinositol deacetylase n=1 Tax=Eremothecium cymbalariae (strain CBS 270.75 / DBVPG 7215 / KCTC 17166 / NRRL Y-17582) TaxID=931890 RepID=G8JSC4_ERECY|nr:hypothetical protein Ecym_4617 [Eremothecium cymbalariae DBVPG\